MKILSIVMLFISTVLTAQTNRFIYELKFKENRISDDYKKAYMVLDINPDETKYYDHSFLVKDSINKLYHQQNTNWTSQIPIVRKKNSNTNLNYVDIGNLYAYETTDVLNWKLSPETKKIDQFDVQKATVDFGGRKWTAWFTKDLPFSEGPYKFQGLPGMVLHLQDDKEDFIFDFVKNVKLPQTYDTSDILEVRYGNKPLKISEKLVMKKAKEYFNDPLSDVREGLQTGKIKSFENYGVQYGINDLAKLTKEEQEDILETYNPIEVDKAFYPVK